VTFAHSFFCGCFPAAYGRHPLFGMRGMWW